MFKIFSYIKGHAVLSSAVAIVAIVAMIIAGRVANRDNSSQNTTPIVKKVTLVDVSSFQNANSKVSADGIVESISQVDLRSQISAPIVSVNVGIGDTVYAGQTIAIMQNADVRALLDQARAQLRSAQGQYEGSGVSLESSKRTAVENIRSAYILADEVINLELGNFLYKETGSNPSLSSFIVDKVDVELENSIRNNFRKIENDIKKWDEVVDRLNETSDERDIQSVLNYSQNTLKEISDLLDLISSAITEVIPKTVNENHPTLISWQSTVNNMRNDINSSSIQITNAVAALSNAQITVNSPAEAQISSAEATVRNLEAQLAKTIITSPISGKIAELPLRAGELAQPGQLIATVVGGGGLQIRAYASGEDLPRLRTGAKATINENVTGTIVTVAPSVSQVNRRVEVKIAINNPASSGLIIGQNVSVQIDAEGNVPTIANNNYLLPIQNVKIVPGAAYVYSVDSESIVTEHSVIIGRIQGDFVEITQGITPGMKIISPVYDLEEGETVQVR